MTRTRLATVGTTMVAAILGSVALSGPALAAKPAHAGPATVDRVPLAAGAPTFRCDGRRIRVTGGEFVFRTRELPHERFLGTVVAKGGVGVDRQGNRYKIRVSGQFRASQADISSRLKVVLIGRGEVHRVQFRFSAEGDEGTDMITGDCTI